jgi:hypothetical protein
MKVCHVSSTYSLNRLTPLLLLARQLSHGLLALRLLSRGKTKFSRSSLDPSPSHHFDFCSVCELEIAVAFAFVGLQYLTIAISRSARSGASLSHSHACTIMEIDESIGSSDMETNPKLFGLDYSSVPHLRADFSNFPEWAAAVNRYAEDNNLRDILNWTPESPRRPRSGEYSGVPATSDITNTKHKLWHNNRVMDHYSWCHTRGATDAWVEILDLRAERDSNPVEFVRKFKSAMVKLNRFKHMRLNKKQQVLQFIAATKSAFFEYAYEYILLLAPDNMTLELAYARYLKFTNAMAKLDCFRDLDLSILQRSRLFRLAVDSVDHEVDMALETLE